MTPSRLRLHTDPSTPTETTKDLSIDNRLEFGPFSFRWRTHIEDFRAPERFIDCQERGPYRSWWHEHHFSGNGSKTVIEDRVYYAPPLGVLGRLAHRALVAPTLREIFGYRHDVMRLRFGEARE
jgi:hypothetical protein